MWWLLLACAELSSMAVDDARLRTPGVTGAYDALPAGAELDGDLEVLFAPDDPVHTLELALIDEVIDGCVAVDCDSADGFAIHYAVYNLRNPEIVAALIEAWELGVEVQVLMEHDQLDESRTWNTADEAFAAAGMAVRDDHRDLDAAERAQTQLLGIGGSGLMHLKTRLFTTPARTRLLTGSMNPGDNAVYNDETLHLVNDADVVAAYAAAYDAVLHDGELINHWDDDAAINALFTPEDGGPEAREQLWSWLEDEDEQILLMVYSLRDLTFASDSRSLVQLLADKVAAGVEVVVVTDLKQSRSWGDTTASRLREAGVVVYEVSNSHNAYTAMHHKVAVLGRTHLRVITDAANWTRAGLGSSSQAASNVESVLFIDSEALDGGRTGRRYLGQVLRVLDSYAPLYGPLTGEPELTELLETLQGDGDWPTEPVRFAAEALSTAWGESGGVRGELDVLGGWGPGPALSTSDARYPGWDAVHTVELPVGVPFSWKLVAGYTLDDVRWEAGADRYDAAVPTVLVPADETRISGTWRD